jgi:hypothetical protein
VRFLKKLIMDSDENDIPIFPHDSGLNIEDDGGHRYGHASRGGKHAAQE